MFDFTASNSQLNEFYGENSEIDQAAQKAGLSTTEGRHKGWLEITDTKGILGAPGTKHYIEILDDKSEIGIRTRQFLHLGHKRLALNTEHTRKFVGMSTTDKGIGHRTAMLIAKITGQTKIATNSAAMWKETRSAGEFFRKPLRKPSSNTALSTSLQHDIPITISQNIKKRLKILGLLIPKTWESNITISYAEFVIQLAKNNKDKKTLHLPTDGSALSPEEALLLQKIASKDTPIIAQKRYYQPQGDWQQVYKYRSDIYQETLLACDRGYIVKGRTITVDNDPMLQETRSYNEVPPLDSPSPGHTTQFKVQTKDTFEVLLERKREGGNPVGVNFANRHVPGGGVVEGCPAQEESLCRRSNHILGLKTQKYPFSETGGIYCPHVQIFRNQDFTFMEEPQEVSLVAVAAYDLRSRSQDRTKLGLPLEGAVGDLSQCQKFTKGTKVMIRNMLRTMALKGHKELVLGALGCGAFENPPQLMAHLFKEVFEEDEFKGRFKTVDFAILSTPYDGGRSQPNIDAFTAMCTSLDAK